MGDYKVLSGRQIRPEFLTDESKILTADPSDVLFLAFPETIEHLEEIVSDAYGEEIPVRIQGARSGLTSGCVPRKGKDGRQEAVIATDNLLAVPHSHYYDTETKRVKTVLHDREITYGFNKETGEIILPAGATLNERRILLDGHGRLFPINPTHQDATIAGNIKTNATGLEGAFGSTRDWTIRLGQILGNGERYDAIRGHPMNNPSHVYLNLGGTILTVDMPTYEWRPVKNAS